MKDCIERCPQYLACVEKLEATLAEEEVLTMTEMIVEDASMKIASEESITDKLLDESDAAVIDQRLIDRQHRIEDALQENRRMAQVALTMKIGPCLGPQPMNMINPTLRCQQPEKFEKMG